MSKRFVKITEVMLAVLLAVCGVFVCAKMLFNNNVVASAEENDGVATVATDAFDGGSGTSSSPYLISSASALKYFLNGADTMQEKYYKLTTNISYGGSFTTKRLYGYFDGGGYTITMSSVMLTSSKPALFSVSIREFKNVDIVINNFACSTALGKSMAVITQQNVGTISNVGLTINNYVTVNGCNKFGFIAAENSSTIEKVSVELNGFEMSGAPTYFGTLVGYNTKKVDDCTVESDITLYGTNSASRVGGICGYSDATIISCSYSGTLTVDASATYYYVGGILGQKGSSSTNLYNTVNGCVTNKGTVTNFGTKIGG